MTQEEKAKAYDEAVRKAKDIIKYYETHNREYEASIEDLEAIFPELKESEDERIRKEIISIVKSYRECCITEGNHRFDDCIAWLEKQNEQSVEPDWCHHKVDFSGCSEEYRKAYYDGWNSCNMQHSQCSAELDDVIKYLVNVLKHYEGIELDATGVPGEWHTSIKHIIEVLERLSKMTQSYTNNN
jgi:hypothetical protein